MDTLNLTVNGHSLSFIPGKTWLTKCNALIIFCFVLFALLLIPKPAFADPIGDFFTSLAENAYKNICEYISNGGSVTVLTAPFSNLFGGGLFNNGDGTTSTIYTTFVTIKKSVINPIGASILALVILMRLLKMSQRMDANSQMPALREVLELFVYCAIWMFVMRNSTEILEGIYNLINNIGKNYFSTANSYPTWGDTFEGFNNVELGALALDALLFVICDFLFEVANMAVVGMAWARALQIYILMMFAPVGFAFFGFDETKPWALGYLKTFISVCLSGLIMLIAVWLEPLMLPTAFEAGNIALVAVAPFLLMFICFHSGQYARDILGG